MPGPGNWPGRFPGCAAGGDWQPVVRDPGVDAVIVSTTNQLLAPITLEAVKHGKHVLVEKPGGAAMPTSWPRSSQRQSRRA